jgi:hypothetical protein
MQNEEKRIKWLKQEQLKHHEITKWLGKKINKTEQFFHLTSEDQIEHLRTHLTMMADEEFKKLKSSWSSHTNRKNSRSISCSIDPQIYKKLNKIKGKHALKDTLEIMIALVYKRQTETSLTNITPLLDEFPSIDSVELGLSHHNTDVLTPIHHQLRSITETVSYQIQTTSNHEEAIQNIRSKLFEIENSVNHLLSK